jgi:uncharacterized protein
MKPHSLVAANCHLFFSAEELRQVNSIDRYRKPSDLPAKLPVFPLAGALLLPRTDLPLNLFEPRYLELFEAAMAGDRIVGMIQPVAETLRKDPKLAAVGCAGRITSYNETGDGRLVVTLTGIARFKVKKELKTDLPYRMVQADYKPFAVDFTKPPTNDVNRTGVLKAFRDYLEANNMTTNWSEVEQVPNEMLVNSLSLMAPYPAHEKQALLEAEDVKARAEMLIALTELALARQSGDKGNKLQ